jgi:hypothetical protein
MNLKRKHNMAKRKPRKTSQDNKPSDHIDLDGDEPTKGGEPKVEGQGPDDRGNGVPLAVPVPTDAADPIVKADDGRPTFPDFLDGEKKRSTGGDGTGNRPWVFTASGVREPREGDEDRPQCPRCSTDEVAVLCGAKSSPTKGMTATTWYYCPVGYCTHSVQKLRPQIADAFIRRQRTGGRPPSAKPHVSRPT